MSMDNLNRIASELQNPSVGMDRLAQYAQGTNPLIPQYMALAEIQRRQDLTKLEPGQASTTTVAQDLVTKALAPQMPQMGLPGMAPQQPPQVPQQAPQGVAGLQAPQGVAALPSGMGGQSFAGGGIVAFDEGGHIPRYDGRKEDGSQVKDPNADTSLDDNAYLDRSRGLVEGVRNLGGAFTNLRNYDPLQKGSDLIGGAINSVQKWGQTPLEQQAATFRQYSQSPSASKIEDESGRGVVTPAQAMAAKSAPQNVSKDQYLPGVKPDPLGRFVANSEKAPDGNPAAPAGTPTYGSKVGSINPNAQAPGIQPKSDATNQYIEMLKEQMAEGKAGKEQDKYLRLLEAGLGIMGGTSPYAAVNIGAGATPAVRGYAQDVAAAGKAARENIGQMATIEAKQQEIAQDAAKTAVTAEHYKNMDANDKARIGVLSQANGDAKTAAGVSAIFGKLADAHKNDIDKGDLDYATLYQQAQQMYNSTTGKNVGSAGAPVATQKTYTYDPTTRSFN